MTSTWIPPWDRTTAPGAGRWTGLPTALQRHLQLSSVPLVLLAGVVVWSTWVSGHALLTLDVSVALLAAVAASQLWTRHQIPAALVLAALAALSPAATPAATAMAAVTARLRPAPVAIPIATAGIAGHVLQGLWRHVPLELGWWTLCAAAIYAALTGWGAWARTRSELLLSLHERAVRAEREQAERLRRAKLDERSRIAREMHDTLAHHLTLIATTAGAIEYRPDADPAATQAAAGRVRAAAGDALVELREILRILRTDQDELRPARGVADIETLVDQARADGTQVSWERNGHEDPPPAVGLAAYRIVQEALTNARRHAPGAPVEIALTTGPGRLDLAVVNGPGVGQATDDGAGTGLVGLTERVALLGGTLTACPENGGFAVTASIPWQAWTRSASS
jgi:signal transduction histidine kinase